MGQVPEIKWMMMMMKCARRPTPSNSVNQQTASSNSVVITSLKQQFELYTHRECNCPGFSATVQDIRQFTGILLLSGYHSLPYERDYWSTADDLGCHLVLKGKAKAEHLYSALHGIQTT